MSRIAHVYGLDSCNILHLFVFTNNNVIHKIFLCFIGVL